MSDIHRSEPATKSFEDLRPRRSAITSESLGALIDITCSDQGPQMDADHLLDQMIGGSGDVLVVVKRDDGTLGCALVRDPFVNMHETLYVYETYASPPAVNPYLVAHEINNAMSGPFPTRGRYPRRHEAISQFQPIAGVLVLAASDHPRAHGMVFLNIVEKCAEYLPVFKDLVDILRAGEQIGGIPTAFTSLHANPN